MTAVIWFGLAVALVLLARWGFRHADELPATTLPEGERARRVGVMRRGAVTCSVVAAVFVVAGVVVVFSTF